MATKLETVEYICDQAALGRRLGFRKMFGEYALYLDEKVVALVCDDQLYLKDTPEGRACLDTVALGAPYPGAKPHLQLGTLLDDPDRLSEALRVTARVLPAPKPMARSRKKSPVRARRTRS